MRTILGLTWRVGSPVRPIGASCYVHDEECNVPPEHGPAILGIDGSSHRD